MLDPMSRVPTPTPRKAAVLETILAALADEFESARTSSVRIRAAGNDSESKAEGKYDTRSTEDNYLADGLAKQAQTTAQAADAFKTLPPSRCTTVELGALVELEFEASKGAGAAEWFFIGPAAGGIEVDCGGFPITVLTRESPLGSQLLGLQAGDRVGATLVRTVL